MPIAAMSEEEGTNLDIQEPENRKASPIAGCLIFIILFAVFITLGGFIVYTYSANKKAMEKISQPFKREVGVAKFVPAHLESLKQKLEKFSEEVKKQQKTSLTISSRDLNIGIAKLKKMEEFRGKLFITKISPEGISASIALPVKAGLTGANRYINGTMLMRPVIEQGSLFPKIHTITTDTGGEVIERIKRFLPQALFSSYRTDPDLIAVFHEFSKVELKEDAMIIHSDPSFSPPSPGTMEEGRQNLFTGLAVVGILFFVFFSSGVLVYLIAKKNKQSRIQRSRQREQELNNDQKEIT